MSHVYFMRAADGTIKIGISENPAQRAADIQTAHSGSIEILGCVPGDRSLEQALHATFASLRIRGEWFRPGEALLAYIEAEAKPLPAKEPAPRGRSRAIDPTFAQRLSDSLRREFGSGLSGVQACGRAVGCSMRTVENWFRGKALPQWKHVRLLLRKSDSVLDNAVITDHRQAWFTDKFRPRHLMTLVSVADEETAKGIFEKVKSMGEARKMLLDLGGDTSVIDARLAELADAANEMRPRAA